MTRESVFPQEVSEDDLLEDVNGKTFKVTYSCFHYTDQDGSRYEFTLEDANGLQDTVYVPITDRVILHKA